MAIRFDDRVVIVTGGGNGLGRSHCLQFAKLGAKVVVNDLGGSLDGKGESSKFAKSVVKEIRDAGGEAVADPADVTNSAEVNAMVQSALDKWGRVDILVNNAGILRDKTLHKMEIDNFKKVVDVHLIGAVNCTKAVWGAMKEQDYGRIVMTSSGSGLFGNFGQSNYGSGKMALIGLMNVLCLEGSRYNIKINALAPSAMTRMNENLPLQETTLAKLLKPELVSPAVLYLASEDAPNRTILGAGCGSYAVTRICETPGYFVSNDQVTPDDIAENWDAISNPNGQSELEDAAAQTTKFAELASEKLGITFN